MAEAFLDHPAGWKVITLEPRSGSGYIERVESGGTPSTSVDEYWDGDVPWLTPKEITRGNGALYVSSTERNITDLGVQSSAAKLMPVGTVMLTKRAPVGAVAISTVPMCTNQGFLNFICGEKLLPTYLAYWLVANKKYLDAVANGSTYPELYKGDLFEFQMAVPSIEQQKEILRTISSAKQLALCLDATSHSAIEVADVLKLQKLRDRIDHFYSALLPIILSGRFAGGGA
ncbi:restriction endonuclease subunit S [Neisseria sicca]|jgi:putative type-1 restriction enzyme mjaXP specificity protein|uniref:restriction endonuclease subunit S n=1 Tax=Neisseria sicca TaxID=490 RepID=UPI000D30C801|nr:restriction endonuclease subunit S [Neisseria sicca]